MCKADPSKKAAAASLYKLQPEKKMESSKAYYCSHKAQKKSYYCSHKAQKLLPTGILLRELLIEQMQKNKKLQQSLLYCKP